jgi:hypothetical protein
VPLIHQKGGTPARIQVRGAAARTSQLIFLKRIAGGEYGSRGGETRLSFVAFAHGRRTVIKNIGFEFLEFSSI